MDEDALDLLEKQMQYGAKQQARMKKEIYKDHISYLFSADTGEKNPKSMQ